MKTAEKLLAQNEEIFQKISEDFDKLALTIENVNHNHSFLADSLLELKNDLISIPAKTDRDLSAVKNKFENIQNSFTNILSDFNEIEKKLSSQKNEITDKLNTHKLSIESNFKEIQNNRKEVQKITEDLECTIKEVKAEYNLKISELNESLLSKIDQIKVEAEKSLQELKSDLISKIENSEKQIVNQELKINNLQKRSTIIIVLIMIIISFTIYNELG